MAARTNREGERVGSPEESRPMGLTSNENLRANWILEQYAFMKPVDGMARQQLLNRISWRDQEEDPSSPARWEDYQHDL